MKYKQKHHKRLKNSWYWNWKIFCHYRFAGSGAVTCRRTIKFWQATQCTTCYLYICIYINIFFCFYLYHFLWCFISLFYLLSFCFSCELLLFLLFILARIGTSHRHTMLQNVGGSSLGPSKYYAQHLLILLQQDIQIGF